MLLNLFRRTIAPLTDVVFDPVLLQTPSRIGCRPSCHRTMRDEHRKFVSKRDELCLHIHVSAKDYSCLLTQSFVTPCHLSFVICRLPVGSPFENAGRHRTMRAGYPRVGSVSRRGRLCLSMSLSMSRSIVVLLTDAVFYPTL